MKTHQPFIYHNVYMVRVIDGDTVQFAIDVGFRLRYKDNFRLSGIDTPERGQPGFEEAGAALQTYLIQGEPLRLEVTDKDKYGRYLCVIYAHDAVNVSINQRLLNEGYAQPYEGGRKP